MSELARELIAENVARREQGEDASYLDLGRCGLAELPEELGQCIWVEVLVLSNTWYEWKAETGKWEEQQSQNQGEANHLHKLDGVERLERLNKLFSGGDIMNSWSLHDLSPLAKLQNLQSLDCRLTEVQDLSPLAELQNLQSLNCNHIKAHDLSPLSGLRNLQALECRNKLVQDLGPLSTLLNLRSLNCSDTQIRDLSLLSNLLSLESLSIWSTQVQNLSPLSGLQNLQSLYCHMTRVVDLSPLSGLQSLQSLNCSINKVQDLSPLSGLQNLQWLVCGNTQVQDLSPLSSLHNLRLLICSDTQIQDLRPLSSLQNLQTLNFDGTQVTDLSPLAKLQNLQSVYCSRTHVQDLSPLSNLNHLTILNLSDNQISDLTLLLPLIKKGVPVTLEDPRAMFIEKRRYGINLHDNPLTTPPSEIVQQGNAAILRYFEDIEQADTDQIYEAKLLLIGEGGAGKTSLLRKLFDPAAELPKEEESTQGIDIQPLRFPMADGREFRLNIWDFAGQGKYQVAHNFFYTHRSLYIFVDDTRALDENEAYKTFYYHWLQTVELFGGQSPLLVLHNQKADRTRKGFNLGTFQVDFPFVKELFRINLGGGDVEGILSMRREIEHWATKLDHVGDNVPASWKQVRDDIAKEKEVNVYISDDHYRQLCANHGITDELRQNDLSHYLHDIGVFLHFQDNPLLCNYVFLQNQWVTDAVYKVLDDEEIGERKRGTFDEHDLARLWADKLWAKRRYQLLALMQQFEVCYPIQDSTRYLAPQLVPGNVPEYHLGGDIPLQLRYEYRFMPKGLLYRLIVRLHRYVAHRQTAVWSSGALLERADAQAEIKESLDRRILSVRVVGNNPRQCKELTTVIDEEIARLNATYGDRLQVEVRIPCNCRICKAVVEPHFYDKSDLDKRLQRNKPTVECAESYDNVHVQGLLDGVFAKLSKEKGQPLKLFVSYSKHDRQDYLEPLLRYLRPLVRGGWLTPWYDHQIPPGEEWDDTIKHEIERADIILLLVSAHSLNTDYIWNVEIKAAMRRREAGTARVVPVILSKCRWTDKDPNGEYIFPPAKLNALPAKGRPVSEWERQEDAWDLVAEGIKRICMERKG